MNIRNATANNTHENDSSRPIVVSIPRRQISNPSTTPVVQPLMLPQGRMVLMRNNSSTPESEVEQRFVGHFINQMSAFGPLPSSFGTAPTRPLSAPESHTNGDSPRIFHRTAASPNSGATILAVSSTPTSNTSIVVTASRPATAMETGSVPQPSLTQNSSLNEGVLDEDEATLTIQNGRSLSECVREIFERSIEKSSSERGR